VAFSGEVTDDESGVEKVSETSALMNPALKRRDLRDAFATDDSNVLLVANKFQTGFDQPLLVAMYVDKRLSGVAAVQTLSRLNRTAPGKDQTFVIDFANSAEDIVTAFAPYYRATTLADVTDPNIVHETMNKLDAAGMYLQSEIDGLVADFLAKKGNNALTKWVTPAQHRFRDRERTAKQTDDLVALEELELFRKDVSTFLRQYDFLSQIVNYEDPSLEKLSIYLRHLVPTISHEQLGHEIDLSGVEFDYLAHHQQATASAQPGADVPLQPAKEVGKGAAHKPEMVPLDVVIEKINDLFDGDHPESSVRSVIAPLPIISGSSPAPARCPPTCRPRRARMRWLLLPLPAAGCPCYRRSTGRARSSRLSDHGCDCAAARDPCPWLRAAAGFRASCAHGCP